MASEILVIIKLYGTELLHGGGLVLVGQYR